MNATLLEISDQTACPSQREVELAALVEKLLGEVAQLRGEVAELRRQVGYWKGMFEQAKRKNQKLRKEIDSLRAENRQLKNRLFAAKSEKKRPQDRSSGPDDSQRASERRRGHQPGSPGPRRRDHSHLPVVEEIVELWLDERVCPKCGKLAGEMTETEDSELIEVEIRAHRRRILARNGESFYRQADETRWSVFVEQEGKTNYRWWLWAFLGEDTTAIRIEPTRSHDVPQGHYAEEAKGILMVDRYSAYKAMAQVKSGVVILAFCWAHVRRDFIAVGKGWPELTDWAITWLRGIRELYHLNRQRLWHESETSEFASCDTALREAIDAMHQQATEESAQPKLREPCRKALQSLLDHWSGLTLFVDDPKIPMHNNASERTVRGPAMSRKNYYGSGSLWSVCLTTAMFSIVATLKQWGLNPRGRLSWYLKSCAAPGGRVPEDVAQFLPWNLTAQRCAKLTSPEASVPINDSS